MKRRLVEATRVVGATASGQAIHVRLSGLPRTALPSDIRRLIARERVEGVSNVGLEYRRFQPVGRACLTMTHPDYLPRAIKALDGTSISAFSIEAWEAKQSPAFAAEQYGRMRGNTGRLEAAERVFTTGDGLNGGIATHNERNIVIWGMPGKIDVSTVRKYLSGFQLAGAEGGKTVITAVHKPDKEFSTYSRFLVRAISTAEAHRLVRALHMTYFQEKSFGKKYQVRARVIF